MCKTAAAVERYCESYRHQLRSSKVSTDILLQIIYLSATVGGSRTWVIDTGITLIHSISTAGNSVAHLGPFGGAATLDQMVLTTRAAHGVPLTARAVVHYWSCRIETNVMSETSNLYHLYKYCL